MGSGRQPLASKQKAKSAATDADSFHRSAVPWREAPEWREAAAPFFCTNRNIFSNVVPFPRDKIHPIRADIIFFKCSPLSNFHPRIMERTCRTFVLAQRPSSAQQKSPRCSGGGNNRRSSTPTKFVMPRPLPGSGRSTAPQTSQVPHFRRSGLQYLRFRYFAFLALANVDRESSSISHVLADSF